MPEAAQATDGTQRPAERRRVPRVRFKATSVVTETSSSQALVAQTTQLSCFGCFVQTSKSYPKGARVHIEMTDGGTTFAASGVVAYVRVMVWASSSAWLKPRLRQFLNSG